ncbi:FecR family protein [Allosphingosinicella humi]
MSQIPESDGRRRTPAEWFALMHGPATPEEREAFSAWVEVPENAEAYERLVATWDRSIFLANRPVGRNRDLSRARKSTLSGGLVAAGLAALAVISGSIYYGTPKQEVTGVQSASPEIALANDAVKLRTVQLRDGSRLILDRGAAIRDLSTDRERHFVVLRGRVRFEVAHDATRAFVVDGGTGRVIAHGTVFDVAVVGEDVQVVLVRGAVEVARLREGKPDPASSRNLSPGQQVVVRNGGVAPPTSVDTELLSWPDDMIAFSETPLTEALATFNRTNSQAIRLEAGSASAERLSGTFLRNDPEGFASTVAGSFELKVAHGSDGAIILRKPPEPAG